MMIDKRLVNLVPGSKKYVFFTVLLRFFSLVANTAFIFCTANILKSINKKSFASEGFANFTELLGQFLKDDKFYIIFMLLCLAVTFFANFFSSRTSFLASSEVKIRLRSLIYQKLLELGTDYQEKSATAKVIQTATEGVEQVETWFSAFLPQFYYAMLAAVFTFCTIAFFNLKMALVLLLCVPLIPLSMAVVQGIAKKILGKYWEEYANLADNFLENLEGLSTLQIYGSDAFKAAQMAREAQTFRRVTMKVLSMQLNSIIIMDVVAYGGAALGICVAISSFYAGNMDFYAAFFCILLSADFFIPLRRLGSAFHVAMNGVSASKNIWELLDTPGQEKKNINIEEKAPKGGSLPLATAASASSATPSPGGNPPSPLFHAKNLSCSFGERTALKDSSFSVTQGSFVAFVGKSGSGKSTLAKILSGIYNGYSGSVKFSGQEIKNISRDELYKTVTYISHRDWIFAGTVRDCLLEGNSLARDEELWSALKKVNLADFVRENGGLFMPLREGGSNLSGGQRQRLSLARAILHDSPVMIFDEATSNIDVESEQAILSFIRSLKGKKTVIMISHRKENCQDADRIFYFENGNFIYEKPTFSYEEAAKNNNAEQNQVRHAELVSASLHPFLNDNGQSEWNQGR